MLMSRKIHVFVTGILWPNFSTFVNLKLTARVITKCHMSHVVSLSSLAGFAVCLCVTHPHVNSSCVPHMSHVESRDSNGISKLDYGNLAFLCWSSSQYGKTMILERKRSFHTLTWIKLILPYKISCIKGSSEIPLLISLEGLRIDLSFICDEHKLCSGCKLHANVWVLNFRFLISQWVALTVTTLPPALHHLWLPA